MRCEMSAGCLLTVTLLGLPGIACHRPPASAAPAGAAISRAIVDPYLEIGTALAADRVDGVTARAGEIATAASSLGAAAFKIDTAAVQLTSAADLADARAKFGVLSDAIDSYMTNQHLTSPSGVRVAFCPMVQKPWLQQDGELRNPYYGSQMLTCGSFRNN
ncbi:MAG: hypothetical protein ABI868_00725 [Acidobacteriota bacterium]